MPSLWQSGTRPFQPEAALRRPDLASNCGRLLHHVGQNLGAAGHGDRADGVGHADQFSD